MSQRFSTANAQSPPTQRYPGPQVPPLRQYAGSSFPVSLFQKPEENALYIVGGIGLYYKQYLDSNIYL